MSDEKTVAAREDDEYERWIRTHSCQGDAHKELVAHDIAPRQEDYKCRDCLTGFVTRDDVVFSNDKLIERREHVAVVKKRHQLSKVCDWPHTCGACHFWSGYTSALDDILNKEEPAVGLL